MFRLLSSPILTRCAAELKVTTILQKLKLELASLQPLAAAIKPLPRMQHIYRNARIEPNHKSTRYIGKFKTSF
jgi:hypothetical protein